MAINEVHVKYLDTNDAHRNPTVVAVLLQSLHLWEYDKIIYLLYVKH